jgi:anti-sigma factor RsiW
MALNRTFMIWSLGYLAVMAAIVAALVVARRRVVATLDRPEARAQWRKWKEQTARPADASHPTQRRPVTSDEPPALILMRDRFAAIVVTTVLIGSFLFAFLAFVVRGAFRGGRSIP